MKPTHHVIISGGVSAVFALWAQSWGAVVACFLSGIFIDLDHHLDYFIFKKELPLSYKKLVHFLRHEHRSKLFLFLHSYEVLVLIWSAIFLLGLDLVWIGIAIGFTTHILCDEAFNPISPRGYFLTYRAKNRFARKVFFKKGHHDETAED